MRLNENTNNKMSNNDAVGKVTGFFLFRNLIAGYNDDKAKPQDQRQNIKKYGVVSVILSAIALIISGSCLISTIIDFDMVGFSYVLINIIFIVGGVILSALLSIYGFVFGVMQVRLNRKGSGLLGLVLSILSMVSAVLLIVFMII